ncbi:MAG TPA: HD domain-containing phosphohydrolase, partial [Nitrospiraceae bacterium]|nr:HD domain-containing phosphohydrolase [Nitrospiraceae bacterium]
DVLERSIVNPDDAEALREHVRVGAEIARELPRKEIASMILWHHERYDGGGYPDGLSEEAIPLGARVIALAEAVESMVSGAFPHSSPVPSDTIVSNVLAEKGRAFDPGVVDAFLRVLEGGSLELAATVDQEKGIMRPPRFGESPAR